MTGQQLIDTRMVATVRCAPPANKPTPVERDTCAPWLDAEIALLGPTVRVVVALGAFGWDAALAAYGRAGYAVPRPRPRFGHGATVELGRLDSGVDHGGVTLLGCYHPSQQNTFTGRLTAPCSTTSSAGPAHWQTDLPGRHTIRRLTDCGATGPHDVLRPPYPNRQRKSP